MDLVEKLRRTLASGGARAFEVDGAWVGWTPVRQAAERVDALLSAAVARGAGVGLVARNRVWSASAFLGILASARCVVPINPFQDEDRRLDDIERLDLAAIVGEAEDFASGALAALAGRLGLAAFRLGGLDPARIDLVGRGRAGVGADRGACALLIATSGTTGVPKRVPIRFDTLAAANAEGEVIGVEYGESPEADQRSPLIQYSPLAHITGALGVARAGSQGRGLVLLEKFTPEAWIEAIERHRVRVAGLPPTMMRMVLAIDPPAQKLASLVGVWSGSSPVDLRVAKDFEARYGVTVMGNYGATEYCGTVASGSLADRARFGDAKDGAVGRVRRNVADFRIVDPQSGEDAAPGETGVLELRVHRIGPDWMRTSDLASIDADDFLYIHGRADDAINRGGFKIVPSVIGDALKLHPDVGDVAVVALPDERLGEAPGALVEPKAGRPTPSAEDLLRFARRELIAYQVPTVLRVVESLPRTPSFKVDRTAVRTILMQPAAPTDPA